MPVLPCSYSLHNKGWEFIYAKDQTQPVVVNLLNLTASAINISTVLLDACRKHTGLSVCRLYKDPFMLWVRCGSGLGFRVIILMLWASNHTALSLS